MDQPGGDDGGGAPGELEVLRRRVADLTRALAAATAAPPVTPLQTMLDSAPIVLIAFDRAGDCTLHAGRGTREPPLPPGSLVGRSIYALYGELSGARDAIARAFAGETVRWETRSAGRVYDVIMAPHRDAAGAVSYVTALTIDVTARVRVEAALRASEEGYRRIVETTSDGVVTADAAMRITFANARFGELLGYTPAELVGRTTLELLGPAAGARMLDRLPGRRAGVGERFELALRHRDGREVATSVLVTPMISDAGAFEGALAQFTDLTDRRDRMAQQNRLAAIVESSDDAIISRDLDGIIRTWNPAAERLFQYTADEAVGRPIAMLYAPEQAAGLEARRAAVDAGTAVHALPVLALRKDGTRVEVSVAGSQLRDADGAVCGGAVIARDMTAQRRAEGELRHTEEQLRQAQKMESIGRLAGGIAHDFNNLLTVILSSADLALADLAPDHALRPDLEQIEEAGRRAAGLTRQLLAFSRQQVLEPAVLDLNQCVRGLEKMLARLLGEDVRLDIALEPRLGTVFADQGQLEQVLMNLAVNARDAMIDGGTLTIETTNVALDAAHAARHHGVVPGPYVRLAVTDTGTGIDPDIAARIFDPFFTTKAPGKGTGLGLSTVFGIVKQSGGHMALRSAPGAGACFEIYLPRTDPDVAPRAAPVALDPQGGTETVLLVEDDAAVRSVMRATLRRQGYDVLEAQNGGEALLLCEGVRTRIDLLITDVVMPRMNGRQLAERLAVLRPGLRVLFVSGYSAETVAQHGILEAGVSYLQKPVTPDALARKVREALAPG